MSDDTEPKMPQPGRQIDWEAIEREYRAGVLSTREIAKGAGVSHTIINRRAKERGWVKNIAPLVREAVSNKVVSDGVSNPSPADVEALACRSFDVIVSHRKDIARLRKAASGLLAEVEADAGRPAGERMSARERATLLEQLSRITVRAIALERQAFGLDDDTKTPDSVEASDAESPRSEIERRIARLASAG